MPHQCPGRKAIGIIAAEAGRPEMLFNTACYFGHDGWEYLVVLQAPHLFLLNLQ